MLGDSLILNGSKHTTHRLYELNFFYTLLQAKPRSNLYLNIPETLIYGFGFNSATLMCTDTSTSELIIEENISSSGIYEIFQYFQEKLEPGSPIAVIKTQPRSRDKCKILSTLRDLASAWENRARYPDGIVIQRFISSGSFPKIAKVSYSLNSALTSMKIFVKSKNWAFLSQSLYQGVARVSGIRVNEENNFFIKQKDLTRVKEEIIDYGVKTQVIGLAHAIEKVISLKKECKVDNLETSWVLNSKGEFFLINVSFFKILYLVEKELPRVVKHQKHRSEDHLAFRVLFRSKKNVQVRVRSRNIRSQGQSMKSIPKSLQVDAV